MSGAQAAAQVAGCCCRPVPCPCGDPNRPGRIADSQLTAIQIECDGGIDHQWRSNESWFSCSCPCAPSNFGGLPDYVDQATGIRWGYRSIGANVSPEFAPEECEPYICTNAGCGGCPLYYVSANFGQAVARRLNPGPFVSWRTITDLNSSNIAGTWNWRARQVGYCVSDSDPLLRVRNYCQFPYIYAPENLPYPVEADRNGAYVNFLTGRYTGGNVGLIHVIRSASVGWNQHDCYYQATVRLTYFGSEQLAARIAQFGPLEGTDWVPSGVSREAVYRKECRSPQDTVLGGYTRAYTSGDDFYRTDDDCGPIAFLEDFRVTFPDSLTIS